MFEEFFYHTRLVNEADDAHLAWQLWHRYTELKVSVVYRVSDGLNGLNGLNCLNEQQLIAERFGSGLGEPRSIETESKIRKWFLGSHKASQDLARAQILPNIKSHV